MYSFATATAWILFDDFGTARLTICFSSSVRIEGMVVDRVYVAKDASTVVSEVSHVQGNQSFVHAVSAMCACWYIPASNSCWGCETAYQEFGVDMCDAIRTLAGGVVTTVKSAIHNHAALMCCESPCWTDLHQITLYRVKMRAKMNDNICHLIEKSRQGVSIS